MTGDTIGYDEHPNYSNEASRTYFENATAPRVNTDIVVVEALRRQYPKYHLSVVPRQTCSLLGFAAAGHAVTAPIDSDKDRLAWKIYIPSARRGVDGTNDGLAEQVQFGKYLYEYKGKEFVLYIANCRDGTSSYPQIDNQYILSPGVDSTNRLLIEAGRWTSDLHDEVWVFDGGFWQKSRELWESVKSSNWDDVILSKEMKDTIINDVENFFDGRDTYAKLKVPWKRGVIYYGPPGNGKTISIKAMMHALYERKIPVSTLYVKTLASFGGPEYSINQIFSQARRYAPCYLVFEDLDTIVTPNVRSYFFNEVDGLKANDGIFMLGSTNHLDQLDPGLSKRPSRFDRKYLFPNPDTEQRVQYAQFWQRKLHTNPEIDFPDKLCPAIASITTDFSFAYMQEAFIAALLSIAAGSHSAHSVTEPRSKFIPPTPSAKIQSRIPTPILHLLTCHAPHTPELKYAYSALLKQLELQGAFVADDYTAQWTRGRAYVHAAWLDPRYAQSIANHAAVSSMQVIGETDEPEHDGLEEYVLWRAVKKQVEILREEMREDVVGGK